MSKTASKKTATKFDINVSGPVNDGIFDLPAFEKFLHDRIKVQGRTSNLAGSVVIANGSKAGHIEVTVSPNVQFAKRYLKYLTKKFLKKHQLRDFLRVIATTKGGYEVKYYNIASGEEEDEE